MLRRNLLITALFFLTASFCFGQASALRDYVGLIRINYHPDVIELMNKYRQNLERKGYSRSVRSIDSYLQGLSGSGFVYVAPNGTCYILTNEHVVTHADSLSITFERLDGTRTTYDRLKILRVDEEKDLAILYFESGARPFTQGLTISTAIEEGAAVYAAGFPAVGEAAAAWQYTQGIITNAAARIPKNNDSSELFGPYIQHSAQVDPGNSGGPLLIQRQGVPANHAVIGMNTLSARWRQAANYAIPTDQINTFVASALSSQPVNDRELIARKADEFIRGVGVNRAVYDHIADFLSNNCTATNAEWAILELLDKGNRATIQDIDSVFSRNPAEGMRYAVAWFIENSMRTRSGIIRINLESINANDRGGFTVTFNVNGTDVQTEWVKEYGVFRLDSYGNIATGDKSRVAQRERQIQQEQALRTSYSFAFNAAYSYVLKDIGSAINAGLTFRTARIGKASMYFGADFHYAFGNVRYINVGVQFGFMGPIQISSAAIMPFADVGMNLMFGETSSREFEGFPFDYGFGIKGGLMFTTAAVPGLYLRGYYAYYVPIFGGGLTKSHGLVSIGLGYGW
jgi:serine protease Do